MLFFSTAVLILLCCSAQLCCCPDRMLYCSPHLYCCPERLFCYSTSTPLVLPPCAAVLIGFYAVLLPCAAVLISCSAVLLFSVRVLLSWLIVLLSLWLFCCSAVLVDYSSTSMYNPWLVCCSGWLFWLLLLLTWELGVIDILLHWKRNLTCFFTFFCHLCYRTFCSGFVILKLLHITQNNHNFP